MMAIAKVTPNTPVPQCDKKSGNYAPKQCHNGVCVCVNPVTGRKVAGTEGAEECPKPDGKPAPDGAGIDGDYPIDGAAPILN